MEEGPIAAVATSASVAAGSSGTIAFRTPSGNIGCVWSAAFSGEPAQLRCDIKSRLRHPKPAKPRGCKVDWGDSLYMTPNGRAKLTCHGDTAIIPTAKKLAYGKTWRHGGFVCTSRKVGLRCHNRAGHGFFLSRQHWSRF